MLSSSKHPDSIIFKDFSEYSLNEIFEIRTTSDGPK